MLFQFTYNKVGGYPTSPITRDPHTEPSTAPLNSVVGCDLYCGVVWQITDPQPMEPQSESMFK